MSTKCQFHQCILDFVFSWVYKLQIIWKLYHQNINVIFIVIGIGRAKDLIIGIVKMFLYRASLFQIYFTVVLFILIFKSELNKSSLIRCCFFTLFTCVTKRNPKVIRLHYFYIVVLGLR